MLLQSGGMLENGLQYFLPSSFTLVKGLLFVRPFRFPFIPFPVSCLCPYYSGKTFFILFSNIFFIVRFVILSR